MYAVVCASSEPWLTVVVAWAAPDVTSATTAELMSTVTPLLAAVRSEFLMWSPSPSLVLIPHPEHQARSSQTVIVSTSASRKPTSWSIGKATTATRSTPSLRRLPLN